MSVCHDAPDDNSAIELAGFSDAHDIGTAVEVWNEDRLVHIVSWDEARKHKYGGGSAPT
jgi:hypothetical protein